MSTITQSNITLEKAFEKIRKWGPYGYRPSIPGNIVFTILWIELSVVLLWQGYRSRMWWTLYTLALGALCETAGYSLRIYGHYYTASVDPYIAQQVFLVLTPALFAAAQFSILTKIYRIYGASLLSPFRREWLLPVFVTVDLTSMVVQAIGSALAADSETSNKDAVTVNEQGDIVVIGLCIQLFGYGLFNFFFMLFSYRAWKIQKCTDSFSAIPQIDIHMKKFLIATWLSSLLVLARSIFRTVEMAEGWIGEISTQEWYILAFDSTFVVLAVIILAFVSPTKYLSENSANAKRMNFEECGSEKA